jgi:hypothetical protein
MLSSRKYLAVFFTLAITLFVLAWIFTGRFRSYFLEPQYGSWQARLAMMDKCDVGDIAIIGDSRAGAAYQPPVLGANVRNFGFNGVTPVEQYFFINRMLACKSAPKMFVLAFSPRQFYDHRWFWVQSVAFGGLSAADLSTIALNEKTNHWKELYKGDFGAEPPPAVKNWLYLEHFPPFYFANMLGAIGDNRHRKAEAAKIETFQRGGAFIMPGRLKCSVTPAEEAKETIFQVDAETNSYFHKEITAILARGSKVVVGPIPISQSTNEKLTDTFRSSYSKYIESVMHGHPTMGTLGDLFVVQDDCDFVDGIHVNLAGAEKFSNLIKPKIFQSLPISRP